MITVPEIRLLLQLQKNDRRIERWKKNGHKSWTSYGIVFTQLKKIAKPIGINRELAIQLRQQPNYEMKILSFLIDDPKEIPLEETKRIVANMSLWPMSKIYVQNVFSKLPYGMELATVYRNSSKEIERRCGYGYLYYIAKNKKIPDAYFIPIINTIENKLQSEENFVKDAMNNALSAIGKRSPLLREHCLKVAKTVGKVIVDYGNTKNVPVDVVKALKKEKLKKEKQ